MPSQQSFSATNDTKQISPPKTCKVCGDKAHIINYGALSCQSCKTFFRRSGFRPQGIRPCEVRGRCELTVRTRNYCVACRFSKCLAIGMSTDRIRKEDLHRKPPSTTVKCKRKPKAKHAILPSISPLTTRDLLHHNRSALNMSDWTLFSNVIHAFDQFSVIPTFSDIINQLASPTCQRRFHPADAVAAIGSVFESMKSFISCSPDFQVLTTREQQALLNRNLHGVGSFCTYLVFRDTCVFYNPITFGSYDRTYGRETMKHSYNLTKRLDLDSTLFKLMILTIAFSSNCCIVDTDQRTPNDTFLFGTYRLYGSQNVYGELLWKYMIYRYGYDQSVLRFAGLVKNVLDMMSAAATTYLNNEVHHHLVDGVVERVKDTLILKPNEPVALWGKALESS